VISPGASAPPPHLAWVDLPFGERFALERKLENLFGQADDRAAFDALALDKQQALLIISRRLRDLSLWWCIRRVENVYGEGGVGMNFSAWPALYAALARHPLFTPRWANHRGSAGGFRERGRKLAVLHFLRAEGAGGNWRWSVHFDLYNPLASPANALRHWLRESWRGLAPDWQAIDKALRAR
jgi:hypothetical protein